jgi:O-antigen ligase
VVLFALLYNSPNQKLTFLKERKYSWFMLAFAVLLFASFLFSANRTDGMRALQLRLPLFLFPISLGLIRLNKEQRNKILLGCSVIVTAACLVSLACAVLRYRQTNNTAWLYNDALTLFIGQQSIYTSLLVNISIYVYAWHLFYAPFRRKFKILLAAGIAVLFIVSYLLASRNMMLILYTVSAIFSFYVILNKKKYLQGLSLLLGIIIAVMLVFRFFPQTINRFRELAFTQFDFQSQAKESHYAGELTPDQWNGANFRLAAWQCGWQLFKERPLVGVGLGDKRDELNRVYAEKQFHFAINTKKNVHNNYLDILFSTGVAGLFLFLTGWIILPFIVVIRNRDGLAFIVFLTLALAMITENYFDRSIGAILFPFFVTYMLTSASTSLNRATTSPV